jgi:hypothetical protein
MISDMFTRLSEPFDADAISWRVGSTNIDQKTGEPRDGKPASGMALAYLDARDVMDRLDLVCGPEGWQCRYSHVGATAVCEIGIRIVQAGTDEWIWKADGAGATDIEAEKGALSDAFKRAAVRFGVGRYLYGLSSPWVDLQKRGRTWIIKQDQYAKLNALHRSYTGISAKSSAQSLRDRDFDFFKAKIEAATDLEALGSVGREIKEALSSLPVATRDPIHDAYAIRLDEIKAEGMAA